MLGRGWDKPGTVVTANLGAAEIGAELDLKAEEIRVLVSEYGSARAEKSKVLYGVNRDIVVIYAQGMTVEAAAVEQFRLALVRAKKPRLFKAIFEKTIRWTLRPQASEIVRGSKLSARLAGLAAKCWITKPTTPRIHVREKK